MFRSTYMNHELNRIETENHTTRTYRINKVYLFCYDDKKYILEIGYHRLSHFQKFTQKSYKNSFVKHRQFVLVFSLNRTAFSSTIFPCYKTVLAIILSSK